MTVSVDRATIAEPESVEQLDKANWRCRITGLGVAWLIAGLVIFVLSANYGSNLLLVMSLLLIAVLINSVWFAWLNVRRLSLATVQLEPVYAEQFSQISVLLNNPDARSHPGVFIQHQGFNSQSAVPLAKEKLLSATLDVSRLKRGCYPLEAITLSCDYPLGLVRWTKTFTTAARLWVYPAPKGNQVLPKPKAQQGTYLKREQGDFSHVRTYQRGDSLNHIAWKQMARTGDVMTKEFEGGEGLRQTWLDIQDIKHQDIEIRLSQLCRWILSCHQKQLKYGLKLPQQTLEAAQGEGHKENCLQALAQFGQSIADKKE